MPWAKHWDIRRYIKDFRELDPNFPKGGEARYTLLDYLLLRSNPRLRTYIGVQSIIADTGFAKPVVAGALAWLFDRGAIYNVPHRFRVGTEAELEPRKYVFQLTGIIRLGDQWVRYLLFSEEDAQMMLDEWRSIGMEIQVDEAFFTADRETFAPVNLVPGEGDDPERSLSEPSLSERSPESPLSSTSISPSSTSIQAINGGQAAVSKTPAAKTGIHAVPASMLGFDTDDSVQPETKKKKVTPHDDIRNHELVKLFCEETGVRSLNKKMLDALVNDHRLKTEDGIFIIQGGLIGLWDGTPGFANFCRQRIPEMLAMENIDIQPLALLQHLRNLNKPDGKVGFWLWREEYPSLCQDVEVDEDETPTMTDAERGARDAARFAERDQEDW